MSDVTVTEIIAIVFDFDDTLMPDSTSKLLRANGIKLEEFWPKSNELIKARLRPAHGLPQASPRECWRRETPRQTY
jgi:hypothetical protein